VRVDGLALLGGQRRHLGGQPRLQVEHAQVHRQGRLERAALLVDTPAQEARRRMAGGGGMDRVGHTIVASTGIGPTHHLRQRHVGCAVDQRQQQVGGAVDRAGHR
jgi:hypothetical protein